MQPKILLILLTLNIYLVDFSCAWDAAELEIFDLVEEVNKNFYEVLGVTQDCSSSDIRKAYRRLSLQLHPDKNDAPDAEVQFRQLVGIYEVLRDETKRARYNQVLVEGLPSWRQPLYYYRRVRKMGGLELTVWLFVLTIIFQYAIAWGAYWEKKLAVEEFITSKLKKAQKKVKKKKQDEAVDVEEEIKQILVKPSYRNTLPFQLFNAVVAFPSFCVQVRELIKQKRKEKQEALERKRQEELEEEQMRLEMEKEKERKAARRKRVVELPDRTGEEGVQSGDEPAANKSVEFTKPRNTGPWTDDELVELATLMKKYPAGTMERWEKIAEALNRTVFEVTHFAKKIKENAYRPPGQDGEEPSEETEEAVEEKKKKEKTRGGKKLEGVNEADPSAKAVDNNWTQKQQKALEAALAQYPKGSLERWEKIAKFVPGKTKEECMLRVKQLAEMVKRKKQMEEEQQQEQQEAQNIPEEENLEN